MLRKLWDMFLPGDVMLADRLMCTWTEMVMLKQRGVDCVCRLTSHRTADFRRGKRLGKNDHIVKWIKPAKPRSIDKETYDALPEFLLIRECRVQIAQPGFRVRTVIVATTLLDADEFTKDDIAQLYRARWNAELDLKSLKQTLQMDILRLQDTRTRPQGALDAHPGLQPHPYDRGTSRYQTWHRTANDQFQGNAPNTRSLSTRDCPPGRAQLCLSPFPLPLFAGCNRQTPSRRSARQI